MTRDRDIERVLETWLRDGSTEMPDRVFDTVLDRVGRQPQRPLARIQLRVRDMNIYVRAAAIAAVLIIALGAGYALLARSSTPRVGTATPPASALPSAAAIAGASPSTGALPTELVGGWLTPRRDVPALSGSGSAFLVLAVDGSGRLRIRTNLTGTPQYAGLAAASGEGRLTITWHDPGLLAQRQVLCRSVDEGEYTWSVSDDGRTLDLEAIRDDCTARQQAFSGSWIRADCRDTYLSACLGDVPAGAYTSHVFDPGWSGDVTATTGVDGAIRYTVPGGWANSSDWVDAFDLVTSETYATADASGEPSTWHGIYLRAGPVAAAQYDACSYAFSPFPKGSVSDLTAWLQGHPGLDVSAPTSMTIDGRPATMLDIAVDPAWTHTCPDAPDGTPSVLLFTGQDSGAWRWGIGGGTPERQRIILVDLGDDRVVLIAIDDASMPSAFDELVSAAMPIVESFRFSR